MKTSQIAIHFWRSLSSSLWILPLSAIWLDSGCIWCVDQVCVRLSPSPEEDFGSGRWQSWCFRGVFWARQPKPGKMPRASLLHISTAQTPCNVGWALINNRNHNNQKGVEALHLRLEFWCDEAMLLRFDSGLFTVFQALQKCLKDINPWSNQSTTSHQSRFSPDQFNIRVKFDLSSLTSKLSSRADADWNRQYRNHGNQQWIYRYTYQYTLKLRQAMVVQNCEALSIEVGQDRDTHDADLDDCLPLSRTIKCDSDPKQTTSLSPLSMKISLCSSRHYAAQHSIA